MSEQKNKKSTRARRIIIGVVGGIVLVVGVIAIPYPGPGWLIVFAGLGILAQEFAWARQALDRLKEKYDAWQQWLGRQSIYVKAIFWVLTFSVAVLTIWLLNGYGIINTVLHLNQGWLQSPLFK